MSTEALPSAAVTLEEIVAKNPSTALYLPVAERMLARGHISDAISLCEERRSRPGKGVGDHIVLGRCYLADGRLAQAREEFERALQLDRENVVALKSMAGILSHEGRHAEAADLYRAVCRVDPGDLESQSALHQITSGEYAEVRPAEIIVSQGDLSWQPVRLAREEDHLSELALGLPTFESLEAGTLRPTSPMARLPKEPLLVPEDLSMGPDFPRERKAGDDPAAAAAPSRHEVVIPTEGFPAGGLHNRLGSLDVGEFQTSALERLDQVLRPVPVRSLGEVSPATPEPNEAIAPDEATSAPVPIPPPLPEAVELPASVLVEEHPAAPRAGSGRSAVWGDEPTAPVPTVEGATPPAEDVQPPEPTVGGNRAAFETWLRRLGGKR